MREEKGALWLILSSLAKTLDQGQALPRRGRNETRRRNSLKQKLLNKTKVKPEPGPAPGTERSALPAHRGEVRAGYPGISHSARAGEKVTRFINRHLKAAFQRA